MSIIYPIGAVFFFACAICLMLPLERPEDDTPSLFLAVVFFGCATFCMVLFINPFDKMPFFSKGCNHEWVELEKSSDENKHTVYCPSCKKEKIVDEKEWEKMQVDMEYQEKQKKD